MFAHHKPELSGISPKVRPTTDRPNKTQAVPTHAVIIGPDIDAMRASDTTPPRVAIT